MPCRSASSCTHAITNRVVAEHFVEERPTLQPLPAGPFQAVLRLEGRITRDGMVSVDGNPDRTPGAILDAANWVHPPRLFYVLADTEENARRTARGKTPVISPVAGHTKCQRSRRLAQSTSPESCQSTLFHPIFITARNRRVQHSQAYGRLD